MFGSAPGRHPGEHSPARDEAEAATVCVRYEPTPLAIGFPGSIGVFMLYHRDDDLEGRRVYFVSSDPSVLALREQGGRLRSLLLPAGSCPPRVG